MARHYGVTNGRHKLIHFYQKNEWELFDLKKDQTNLKACTATAITKRSRAILAELKRLRIHYKVPEEDPYPQNANGPTNRIGRRKNNLRGEATSPFSCSLQCGRFNSPLTQSVIIRTWLPLAASWLLMGAELPLLSAVVARLDNPDIHLAAYSGIVFRWRW